MDQKVMVRVGRTLNMGNYESEKFDISYECELSPTQDMEKALLDLHEQLTDIADEIEEKIRSSRGK